MPPRGKRRLPKDVATLEQQLNELKEREAELKQQLRRITNREVEVKKLEEKLGKQLSTAKWTVDEIHEIQPDWDFNGFFQSVQARKPAPRGRRPRAATQSE